MKPRKNSLYGTLTDTLPNIIRYISKFQAESFSSESGSEQLSTQSFLSGCRMNSLNHPTKIYTPTCTHTKRITEILSLIT